MKLLNQVAITVIAERLEARKKIFTNSEATLKFLGDAGRDYDKGLYAGYKAAAEAEIKFLESLSAMLSNTPEPSAKIENPEGDGAPAV